MRRSWLLATVMASASCLLGVEYDKVGVGDFCVAPGAEPAPASCRGGIAICGADRDENCCASLPVPCGTFQRDFDNTTFVDGAGREATLSDFRLDRFEVTVARFRAFVNDGAATADNPTPATRGAGGHPKYLNSGWDPADVAELAADADALRAALACSENRETWTDEPGANENRPIDCVTWYEALLFCAWDGGRLPTEAEWNYAAAGGAEQREYPWAIPAHGVGIDLAVYGCPPPNESPVCPVGTSIASAGSKPDGRGRWGQDDLAGNVAEWMLDSAASDYLSPCADCLRIGGAERAVRGGGFDSIEGGELRVSVRAQAAPSARAAGIGFRCARPIAP